MTYDNTRTNLGWPSEEGILGKVQQYKTRHCVLARVNVRLKPSHLFLVEILKLLHYALWSDYAVAR
jgi:hypothetical protein